MKKITKLTIGVMVFIALFYQQLPGINVSAFCMITWLLIFLQRPAKQNVTIFWLLSSCVFLTSISFAWYGDAFSFLSLFLSTSLLGIWAQYSRINILLYPVLWAINYASFIFRVFYFKYWLPSGKGVNNFWKKVFAFVFIPGLFAFFFVLIYASGSELFGSLFINISFRFEFFQIVALLCLGFFLLFNFWFMLIPKEIIRWNYLITDNFHEGAKLAARPAFSFLPLDMERRSGEISLLFLNALLLFFIVTYNYEQFFTNTSGATLSSEIHNRVEMIIFSIAMAIAVIMFFFKSMFNFDTKCRTLKGLAFGWIILNAFLIVSAFIKNGEYVAEFGLTFKRIGVFIFLLLSLAGLIITFLKLKYRKTNYYLLKRMAWIFFGTFVILSSVNFSWIVTKYNLRWHKNEDIYYLRSLDYNKHLLIDTYEADPAWQEWINYQRGQFDVKRANSFLSSSLYYKFTNIE